MCYLTYLLLMVIFGRVVKLMLKDDNNYLQEYKTDLIVNLITYGIFLIIQDYNLISGLCLYRLFMYIIIGNKINIKECLTISTVLLLSLQSRYIHCDSVGSTCDTDVRKITRLFIYSGISRIITDIIAMLWLPKNTSVMFIKRFLNMVCAYFTSVIYLSCRVFMPLIIIKYNDNDLKYAYILTLPHSISTVYKYASIYKILNWRLFCF